MTVYEERKDDLERYEFMWGRERGRLAISLDCITDALGTRRPARCLLPERSSTRKPAMDIQLITKSLTDAKELITSVLEMKANQQVAKDPAEKG